MRMKHVKVTAMAVTAAVTALLAAAAPGQAASRWVDAWTTAAQAAYPTGYEVGQPGDIGPIGPGATGPLLTHAFPDKQARDQTLRMVIHPSIGGRVWRLRLTNVFGTTPVTFGRVRVAVQASGATLEPGTTRTLSFGGQGSVTVGAGNDAVSDPVRFRLAARTRRNLVVNLYVRGASGPMTWHAASFTTSYVTNPGAGDHTADRTDEAFPHSTTSWYYLSRLEVRRRDAATVVAFGDSITDGFFSTMNGNDRWPDVLQRRLNAREALGGLKLSVVNQASPATWSRASGASRAAAPRATARRRSIASTATSSTCRTSAWRSCSRASTTSAGAGRPPSRSSRATSRSSRARTRAGSR